MVGSVLTLVKVFLAGSDKKGRQCITWLQSKGVEFEIYEFNEHTFTYEDFKQVIQLLDNGPMDLIIKRSKEMEKVNELFDIEDLTLKEFYSLCINIPNLVGKPIILGDGKVSIGYKAEDISVFLPRHLRGESINIEEYVKLLETESGEDEELAAQKEIAHLCKASKPKKGSKAS